MLRVNASSPVRSIRKSTKKDRLTKILEIQRYKIECYKAWIRGIDPENVDNIVNDVEQRARRK